MKKLVLLTLFLFALGLGAQENKVSIIKDAGDVAKMLVAKQKYYSGQYLGALSLYRDVEKNEPKNSTVKYYIALCHNSLGEEDKALEFLLKALELNNDVKAETYFMLGKLYHKNENIDQAIENLNTYLAQKSAEEENKKEAELLLGQCQNAKSLMQKPLDVMVLNLGSIINSRFDDKNPCITADGHYLVFTTRRPESPDAPLDAEGDGRYFENIYSCTYDSAMHGLANPVALDKHVNTPAHDACTSISPDGKQLFIYKNDVNNKASRGGNVFVSKWLNGKWKTPQSLGKPVNTTYWEGGVCVSPDGKRYFFTSERKGGHGGSDIWMVQRINKKTWGEPVNLGPTVNSSYDEAGMFLAPDGKTLFFCSNGPKSMGSYDIFRTVFENGSWSEPQNLGYPINTPAKEGQLTLSAGASYAYISSNRKNGFGESDLYKIDLKDFAILEKDGIKRSANGVSILRGTIREGFEGFGMADVEVTVKTSGGETVASTSTNENGEYFVTLKGGDYVLEIKKKGYAEIKENFTITASNKETIVLEKGYLLKK